MVCIFIFDAVTVKTKKSYMRVIVRECDDFLIARYMF